MKVKSVADENLMRFYLEDDDEIARLTAARGGLTVALLFHVTVIVHARGNSERDRSFLSHEALALTVGTFIRDHAPCPSAIGADALTNRASEHSILNGLNDTLAAATRTGAVCCPPARAGAFTRGARLVAHIGKSLDTTLCGIHKAERHFALNIFSDTRLCRTGSAAEAAETATENRAENIREISESAFKAAHSSHAAHTGMFQLIIVSSALLCVGENLVRLVDFLEFFRSRGVSGMKVGVILLRQLSVCRFYLIRARFFAHAQNVVIVLF